MSLKSSHSDSLVRLQSFANKWIEVVFPWLCLKNGFPFAPAAKLSCYLLETKDL